MKSVGLMDTARLPCSHATDANGAESTRESHVPTAAHQEGVDSLKTETASPADRGLANSDINMRDSLGCTQLDYASKCDYSMIASADRSVLTRTKAGWHRVLTSY